MPGHTFIDCIFFCLPEYRVSTHIVKRHLNLSVEIETKQFNCER